MPERSSIFSFFIWKEKIIEVISMMNKNVQLAIAGLLDMFREGNVPEKIAIATNPKFDVPSARWSLKTQVWQINRKKRS